MEEVRQAVKILKGNLAPAKAFFKDRMAAHAEKLEFEKAQLTKEKLAMLEKYEAKSLIINPDSGDFDVLTMLTDGASAFVNFLQVRSGTLVNTDTVEFKRRMEETDEELMQTATLALRTYFQSEATQILTNTLFDFPQEGVKVNVPLQGDKKKLIDLSIKNTIYYKHNKEEKAREQPRTSPNQRILLKLQQDLRLKEYPDHIECFDNSNIQGSNPVSAMVCFKNGVPSKKDYRHYNVKTVEGPDDFATMEEVVYRRYKRVLEEESPLPKLIIIDGGKGQLGAAVESLKKLELYGRIPIIGIAKRLEELYYPGDAYPLHLEKKSESLKLIQRLRDEAHRFGITHHRDKRSKAATALSVSEVKGLGPKTLEKVQQRFKSLKSIKLEDVSELEILIGKAKSDLLIRYLQLETATQQ
jgi:excinuclease ABC subunit C